MERVIQIVKQDDGLLPGFTEDCPLKEAFKNNYGKRPSCFVNAVYPGDKVKALNRCCHYVQNTLEAKDNGDYVIQCSF